MPQPVCPAKPQLTGLQRVLARYRRQTFEEFAEYVETFAREHMESGTLSVRHLQRLAAGCGPKGQPLGPLRLATARLLERILGLSIDELLAPPTQPLSAVDITAELCQEFHGPSRISSAAATCPHEQLTDFHSLEPQLQKIDTSTVQAGHARIDLARSFDWLDEHAGWLSDTSRRKVMSRLAELNARELLDAHARRVKVSRSQVAHALSDYYRDHAPGYGAYRVWCGDREIATSIVSRSGWLDLACPLTSDNDRLVLVSTDPGGNVARDDVSTRHAVDRLAEAAALDVRVANVPLYRLLEIDARPGAITGTVGLAPFVEYALTMDLLESELVDAVTAKIAIRRGTLPLRDRYLPDLTAVLDIFGRLCVGGVLALCAIARPRDPYRGAPDYALLVQERSGHVLNATRRLAVIPKGFHQR